MGVEQMRVCNLRMKNVSINTVSFAFQIDKDEKVCQNFVCQRHYDKVRALSTVHGSEM